MQHAPIALELDDHASSPLAIRTWHLLVLASLLTLVVMWYGDHFVLTHEVYVRLRSDRLDLGQVEQQFAAARAGALRQYLLLPIAVIVRVGFVALTMQLILLSAGVDARLSGFFRATLVAYPVLLFSYLVILVQIGHTPVAQLGSDAMTYLPGSLVTIVPGAHGFDPGIQRLLRALNLYEVAWCALMYAAVRRYAGLSSRAAAGGIGATWLLLTALQCAVIAYFAHLSA